MKKSLFEKIDEQVNHFLYRIVDIFFLVLRKVFPPNLFESLRNIFKPLINRYEVFKYKFDQQVKWLSLKIEKTKDYKKSFKITEKIEELKAFSHKLFSRWYIDKLKRILSERIQKIKEALFKRFERFNQYHLLALTVALVVSGVAFLKIYHSTTNIVSKVYKNEGREIASSEYIQREVFPDYFDYERKRSMISQLVMPAFIEDTGKYENLKINFGIEFTNRTSKRFFDRYRYLFMDQLQVTLEPVLPSFPLSDEGKDIVRKKLFEELNDILMNEGIDGRVERITIIDIIAN